MTFGQCIQFGFTIFVVYIWWLLRQRKRTINVIYFLHSLSDDLVVRYMEDLTKQRSDLSDWTKAECIEAIQDHLELYPTHVNRAFKLARAYCRIQLTRNKNDV